MSLTVIQQLQSARQAVAVPRQAESVQTSSEPVVSVLSQLQRSSRQEALVQKTSVSPLAKLMQSQATASTETCHSPVAACNIDQSEVAPRSVLQQMGLR